jgi:hypothetical protein
VRRKTDMEGKADMEGDLEGLSIARGGNSE